MIELPKQVLVLGKPYTIKIVDEPDNDAMGWLVSNTIHLNLQHANEEDIDNDILCTLVHEIGHAIFRRASLTQVIGADLEEIVVDMFAKVLVEVFTLQFRKKPLVLP